ncbi:MAG: ankyrin repeat domain-containing protein [Candidatus Krumholzibacteriia bacterium]
MLTLRGRLGRRVAALLPLLCLLACDGEQGAWQAAQKAGTLDGYIRFINEHPGSALVATAAARIDSLEVATAFAATRAGDLVAFEAMRARGVDLTATDPDGATLLHAAADGCRRTMTEVLLANRLNPGRRADDGTTALHRACRAGCPGVAALLLDHGADIMADVLLPLAGQTRRAAPRSRSPARRPPSRAPLHWACRHGHADVAALLLARGARVDARTGWGLTPLHEAAASGLADVVQLLLDAGAPIRMADLNNGQPIHHAASAEAIAALAAAGARLDEPSPFRGLPIHNAAYLGLTDAVAAYLDAGLDVDVRGTWNTSGGTTAQVTPAWAAAAGGRVAVLELLADRGADLGFTTGGREIGGSLLHAAAWHGHAAAAEFLLARGLPVDPRGNVSMDVPLAAPWPDVTPLGVAAYYGHTDLATRLLAAGADPGAITANDWSVIEMAVVFEHREIVAMLLARGVDLRHDAAGVEMLDTSDEIRGMLVEYLGR